MSSVTVSPKYQVVIPKEVRKAMDIHPGEKMAVLQYAGHIELIPMRDARKMRGFARGMGIKLLRDKD